MSKKSKSILPVLLTGGLFLVMFFLVIKLYKDNPVDAQYSKNPILDGWYADPEIVIFDSTYWIFPTYSNSFSKQVFLDAFSSKDLIMWEKHARIIDTTIIQWADSAIWAPCALKKEKKYYLFFAANDLQTTASRWFEKKKHGDMIGGIGVAMAEKPGGPYHDFLGKPLIGEVINGAQPIDQFVFNDNGDYYIVYGGWGKCNIGKLNNEFTALVPFSSGEIVKDITPEGYIEGPLIFKRKNTFYMMWSEGNWTNETYHVAYGISDSVLGPYIRQDIILKQNPEIATGAGHHSVLNIPGTDDWYIVYHRRPVPNEGRDHRVTCIDRMYFDEKGKILPVVMTFHGVAARPLLYGTVH